MLVTTKAIVLSSIKYSDADLIVKYLSEDKLALSILVKRWHLRFCKFAFWIVKDAEAAKDIAQESWITIIGNLNNLKEPGKFKSWAISIVNRKSIDWIRAKNRADSKLKKVFLETIVSDNSEKEDEYLKLKIALSKAIVQLPIKQQLVIKLFYTQNYTLKEISHILEISIGTAKSRLFHAREKLKITLKT